MTVLRQIADGTAQCCLAIQAGIAYDNHIGAHSQRSRHK
jgi:hypothetical protein